LIHAILTLIHAVLTLIHAMLTLIHAILTLIQAISALIHAISTLIDAIYMIWPGVERGKRGCVPAHCGTGRLESGHDRRERDDSCAVRGGRWSVSRDGLVHLPEFNTYLRRIYLKREAFHPGQGRSWLERFLEAMRLTLAVSSAENALVNQARIYRSVLG
jgi:hypothetical protein